MKSITFGALALGLMLAGTAQAQETVRIASEGAYAPWNFTNAQGELDGFEPALAQELCKRMDVKCELVAQAWDGMIPALQAGKYDAIMAGMSITPERKEVIDFSHAYVAVPASFLVPKEGDLAEGSADLPQEKIDLGKMSSDEQALLDKMKTLMEGKTVGVQTATTHENFLREYMPDVDVSTYDTQENLDLDMESGRIDAGLADRTAWNSLLENNEDFTRTGPTLIGGPFGEGVGVGLRKDDQELKDKFNEAILAALKDGTIGKLATEWFGFDSSATQ